MSNDVYKAPDSELINDEMAMQPELASRWSRLGAAMIDGIILMLATIPLAMLVGVSAISIDADSMSSGMGMSVSQSLLLGAISVALFIAINGTLLVSRGQTVGKKLLSIKIVDLNGKLPTVKEHLLKRYAVYFISGQIPIIGGLLSLINILFIFGKQKRCVHDYIAGTKVVKSD